MRRIIKRLLSILVLIFIALFGYKLLTNYKITREISYEVGTYQGETFVVSKLPNGYGEMNYNNKSKYTGHWDEGVYNGEGIFETEDGYEEKGYFEQGKLKNGMVSGYLILNDNTKIPITKTIEDFDSEVNELELISSLNDLVDVIIETIEQQDNFIIIKKNNFYDEFVDIFNNKFEELAREVDSRIFTELGQLSNLNSLYYTEFAEDNIIVLEIILRDGFTEVEMSDINNIISKIVTDNIKNDMNEFEKILTLHDYLVNQITYTENLENSHNVYGALVNGQAVCEGYAESFAMLLTETGIENYLVSGDDLNTVDNIIHVWNLVKFEDGLYHIDITWDDIDDGHKYIYKYFGLNDEEIKRTHTMYSTNIPKSGSITNKYYDYYSKNKLETYLYYNNAIYFGQINSEGVENGIGTTNWNGGNSYTGEYLDGVEQGYGILRFSNGDLYKGNFENGVIKGEGTYIWADGRSKTDNWD